MLHREEHPYARRSVEVGGHESGVDGQILTVRNHQHY